MTSPKELQPPQPDPSADIVSNLWEICHVIQMLSEGRGSQKRVLTVLEKTGTITQAQLTEYLGIQSSSVSEILAKLENAGLVTRVKNSLDQRTIDVSLTPAGIEQAQETIRQQQQRNQEMFSALSPAEKRSLLVLLEKVNADWERHCNWKDKK